VFVEHAKRFPRQGELYPYLHGILDESKILEDLDLPPMDVFPMGDAQEAQKSLLEDLVAQNLLLSKQALVLSQNFEKSIRNLVVLLEVHAGSVSLSEESWKKLATFAREAEAIRQANHPS